MKKLKLFALGLLGASTLFMTSCGKDEDPDDPSTPRPNLTVTAYTNDMVGDPDGDISVRTNTTVHFAINAASVSGVDLKDFEITVGGANSINPLPATALGYQYGAGEVSLKNADDESYMDTLSIPGVFLSNQGTNNFQFVVTNKDGGSTTVTIEVEIKNPTPLNNEVNGAFFHIGGSLQGAYDLVSASLVAGSGSSADPSVQDMKNTDAVGDAFTGSWTAGNATLFVKANGYDYANATEESAMEAYDAGTETANVNDPSSGDIYIAKLRGGNDYVAIMITDVDAADNTCSCGNTGKISFDFKRK